MTVMLMFDGAPALYAGARRVALAPHIAALPDGHPVKRFVLMMGAFERDIRAGLVAGPFSQERAELFARLALIDDEELQSLTAAGMTDGQIARRFGVPEDQLVTRRAELALAQLDEGR